MEDENHFEYGFSLLSMRIKFEGRFFSKCACSERKTRTRSRLVVAPVVRRVDSAIHWITHYPLDNSIGFASVYPLDSDLSGG